MLEGSSHNDGSDDLVYPAIITKAHVDVLHSRGNRPFEE